MLHTDTDTYPRLLLLRASFLYGAHPERAS
jgi:hypothetical protein